MNNLFYNNKMLICQICFLALSYSITSCKNDEPQIDNQPTFGYFKGTINGKNIFLEEKSMDEMILFQDYVTWAEDTIACYGFAINIPKASTGIDNISIYTYLSPLSRQLYEIGPIYNPELPFRQITLFTNTNHMKYRPTKTSFKITIDTITTHKNDPNISWSSPRITGSMEGILYNKQNPQDSIIIKNVRFRVWNNDYV